ncbi:S8 family serine peptidase [Marinomonas sp. 2405UD68-3]|uniref:S8 family serine peptidase n=1 Tax=Marinomonas sp. 2405UD68-3 TaxID=3391835 RepID=UPI0039C9C066
MFKFSLPLLITSFALTACGGGGGDGDGGGSSDNHEPDLIVNEPDLIVNEPDLIVNEPDLIMNEPVTKRVLEYQSQGFGCDALNICEKFNVISMNYDGDYNRCDANTGECSKKSILQHTFDKIRADNIDQFAHSNQRYVGAVTESCKYFGNDKAGCHFTYQDGTESLFFADMDISPTAGTFSYSSAPTVSDLTIKVTARNLLTEYNLLDFTPTLPDKPYKWAGIISGVSEILNNSYEQDWGFDLINFDRVFVAMRTPTCSKTSAFEYSCSFIEQVDIVKQCDFLMGETDTPTCNVYDEATPSLKSIMQDQLSFMGFDAAQEVGANYSKSYPVTVYDTACEPNHSYIKHRVNRILFDDGAQKRLLNPNDAQDRNLMRLKGSDWANVASTPHCSGVSSVITSSNGAYIDLLNYPQQVKVTPGETGLGLMNGSWGYSLDRGTAIREHIADGNFYVWAGGNSQQNHSKAIKDYPNVDYIWGTSLAKHAIMVGNIDSKKELYSSSSIPGDNEKVQERWIIALGTEVLSAGSLAGTEDSYLKWTGTSLAAPFVSRALALGKSYCSVSSYENLADTLLATADKSIPNYDPSIHGVGMLDVRAFLYKLQTNCP